MENKTYEELLTVSRKKLHRGDTFSSIYKYLNDNGANEETVKKIIALLNDEDKLIQEEKNVIESKNEKKAGITNGITRIIIGVFILFISWALLNKGLDVNRFFFLPAIAMVIGGVIALIGLIQASVFVFKKNKY